MTKGELESRKALKEERLRRLYLERVMYTRDLKSDTYAAVLSFAGGAVCGIISSMSPDATVKLCCGIAATVGGISTVALIFSGVKNYRLQNAKEAEHDALENVDPKDIDLEESHSLALKK